MIYNLFKERARFAKLAGVLLPFAAALLPAIAEPAMKQPAPALTVETAGGDEFDLGAKRGKVVLVNFWATWCAPCLAEMPAIADFYMKHRGEGFEVIALSIDRPRDQAKMQNLIAKLPFQAALLRDARRNGFGTPDAVPLSYVIDAQGVVRDKFIEVDGELLDEAVLPLLKQARRGGND
jgi:thiol-disulfide isomerase/thioredoxin